MAMNVKGRDTSLAMSAVMLSAARPADGGSAAVSSPMSPVDGTTVDVGTGVAVGSTVVAVEGIEVTIG